jgi:phenylalanyl-tRNA synthetase beta chain
MRVLFEQLKRYVPELSDDADALARRLTLAGVAVDRVSQHEAGRVLELDITTNRPDLLSHIGVAREAAALGGHPLVLPDPGLVEDISEASADAATLSIEAPELCPRYSARIVRGVRVGPSPDWLRRFLEAADVRPICNIVDITNFVLLEMGQPLHAFDLEKLLDRAIVVRQARPGERLRTLDDAQRALHTEDLIIADAQRPVALAGVMGGGDTEVTDATSDVLIESAHFNPLAVRRMARRHGLRTEASVRFERGLDAEATVSAADRAAALMAELAGGRVLEGALDAHPMPKPRPRVELRLRRITTVLGMDVSESTVRRLLGALGLVPGECRDGVLDVEVPLFRPDVDREIDLIEEVGRLVGYDHVTATLPPLPPTTPAAAAWRRNQVHLRRLAQGAGLNESVNLALTDSARNAVFLPQGSEPVELRNPISDRLNQLQVSLLPGLLDAARLNLSRDLPGVALYELATVFTSRPGLKRPEERTAFSCVLAGRLPTHWSTPERDVDAWDVKGLVELLLEGLGLYTPAFVPSPAPGFKAGQAVSVSVDGVTIGHLGRLDPAALEPYGLDSAVYAAELDVTDIQVELPPQIQAIAPSRYPSASRDVSFLVHGIAWADVRTLIDSMDESCIEAVHLIDRYEGKGLPEDATSLTLRVVFRHPDRTLEPDELGALHQRLMDTLGNHPRITLRI